jgi:hypothetical protein
MKSTDFRLPRVQGHAINAMLSVLLWLGVAAVATDAAQTASRLFNR